MPFNVSYCSFDYGGCWKGYKSMEVGGLMAQAFKVVLGNPDIMAVVITWAISVTLLLTVINVYRFIKD